LKVHSPYKVLDVDGAEADDIIGVLVQKYSANEKVMILSSDKDFAQLQRYPNVEQYSPILKKYIKEPFPLVQLKQLIIRGDKSDGIPNILSADNVFVEGVRQKPITEVKIIKWLNQEPKEFCSDDMLRNFSRNEIMIDLTKIPEALRNNIINSYETAKGRTKQEFMNYMIANRLKNLIEVAHEF
jgi:5'-3' exonuclease